MTAGEVRPKSKPSPTPGGNLGIIIRFFEREGLTRQAIAGILGNLRIESSDNPYAYNANEGAIGLAQWEGGRRTALQAYARRHGTTETDINAQLGFLWQELNERGLIVPLESAGSAAEAAAIFDSRFEVSSGSTHQERMQAATNYFDSNYNYGGTGSNTSTSYRESGYGGGGGTGGQMTKQDYLGTDNLGNLFNSVPELRKLIDQAVSNNWTTDKFQNEVENSKWYRTHSDTARAIITQQANDPASYARQLAGVENTLSSLEKQMGMGLTGALRKAIATNALLTGNDNNQNWLQQQISSKENYGHVTSVSNFRGQMAATIQQLQAFANDYGYQWSPAQLATQAQAVVAGSTTIDTYKQKQIAWAKSAFPGLANEIDDTHTVADAANPYIQSMSNLLEVDPSSLSIFTPQVRKALQGAVDPTTKQRTSTPLWQFEDQLRTDPRWQYTQNARDTMSTALVKIGQDFGFGPQG